MYLYADSRRLENAEGDDVSFDFGKNAIESVLKIPGIQELEEK